MELPLLMTVTEVAAAVQVPKRTIYLWHQTGRLPGGIRLGKHLRWSETEIVAWIEGLRGDD